MCAMLCCGNIYTVYLLCQPTLLSPSSSSVVVLRKCQIDDLSGAMWTLLGVKGSIVARAKTMNHDHSFSSAMGREQQQRSRCDITQKTSQICARRYGVKNLLSVMNSHERGGREKWENYHREEANDRQRFIHYFKYDRRKDIPEQRKLSHLSPYYRLIDCWEISLMSLRMKTKSQQCVRESEMLSHFVGL